MQADSRKILNRITSRQVHGILIFFFNFNFFYLQLALNLLGYILDVYPGRKLTIISASLCGTSNNGDK